MKFWKVEVYNKMKMQKESFIVEYWDEPSKIVEILTEVHPEYENIQIKKTKKPKGIKGWSSETG